MARAARLLGTFGRRWAPFRQPSPRWGPRCCASAGTAERQSFAESLLRLSRNQEELQALLATLPAESRGALTAAALKASGENADDIKTLVEQMSHAEVRAFGIAAMSQHYGTDFSEEFQAIDRDQSGTVSKSEFKRYLSKVLPQRQEADATRPSNRQLVLFGLNSAIPFVVFGALDNSIMILGGDVVDDLIGSHFQLSTLACAAVANTFADVLGISIGNTVEALTVKLGLPEAKLTAGQAALPLVRRIGLVSGSLGILIGCIIGMTPLLFMDPDRKALKEAFGKVDSEGAGALDVPALRRVLLAVDCHAEELQLRQAVEELGILRESRVALKDFLDKSQRLKDVLSPRHS